MNKRNSLINSLPPEEIAIIQSATEGQTIPTPASGFNDLSAIFERQSNVQADTKTAIGSLALTAATSLAPTFFLMDAFKGGSPFTIASSIIYSGFIILTGPFQALIHQQKRNRDIQELADTYNKDQDVLYKELCFHADMDAQNNYVAALKAKLDSGEKLTLPELAKLVNVKDFVLLDLMIQGEYNALAITVLQAKMALAQYQGEVDPFEIVNSTDADFDISNATHWDFLAIDLWQQARAMDEIIRSTANQNASAATPAPKPDQPKNQPPRTKREVFADMAQGIKDLTTTKVLKAPFKLAVGLLNYYADGILAIRDAAIPRHAKDYLAPFPTAIHVSSIPVAEDLGAALRYYQVDGVTPPLDLPALARG